MLYAERATVRTGRGECGYPPTSRTAPSLRCEEAIDVPRDRGLRGIGSSRTGARTTPFVRRVVGIIVSILLQRSLSASKHCLKDLAGHEKDTVKALKDEVEGRSAFDANNASVGTTRRLLEFLTALPVPSSPWPLNSAMVHCSCLPYRIIRSAYPSRDKWNVRLSRLLAVVFFHVD